MVLDVIENAPFYYKLGPGIEKALKYLQETDLQHLPPGKYEIDGDRIFAVVQQFDLKLRGEAQWKAHRRYVDVQYVVEGRERIFYAYAPDMTVQQEYDDAADCELLSGSGNTQERAAGTFAIFGPDDAHKTGTFVENPQPVKTIKKVVVKVAV